AIRQVINDRQNRDDVEPEIKWLLQNIVHHVCIHFGISKGNLNSRLPYVPNDKNQRDNSRNSLEKECPVTAKFVISQVVFRCKCDVDTQYSVKNKWQINDENFKRQYERKIAHEACCFVVAFFSINDEMVYD